MEKGKELDYFKDKVFDLLNEADSMDVKDIETDDRNNTFRVSLQGGGVFEVECLQAAQ